MGVSVGCRRWGEPEKSHPTNFTPGCAWRQFHISNRSPFSLWTQHQRVRRLWSGSFPHSPVNIINTDKLLEWKCHSFIDYSTCRSLCKAWKQISTGQPTCQQISTASPQCTCWGKPGMARCRIQLHGSHWIVSLPFESKGPMTAPEPGMSPVTPHPKILMSISKYERKWAQGPFLLKIDPAPCWYYPTELEQSRKGTNLTQANSLMRYVHDAGDIKQKRRGAVGRGKKHKSGWGHSSITALSYQPGRPER